jgi:hypothetical protein
MHDASTTVRMKTVPGLLAPRSLVGMYGVAEEPAALDLRSSGMLRSVDW